jgi:uncharacterized protein involved in outer membrane biogenesis
MDKAMDPRRWLRWALRALLAFVAVLVVLVAGVLIFADQLRAPLLRHAQRHYSRPIRVDGKFELELLSLHPRIVAERVVIGNPSWTPAGTLAEIGHLVVVYQLPWFGKSWGLSRLELAEATLHLFRDEQGHANWQTREPGSGPGPGPSLIHSLSVPNAHVYLDDRRRHLLFDGMVTAQELLGHGPSPTLRITGAGRLNGHDTTLSVDGEPLATVALDRPYRFEFAEASSGSQLKVHGVLPHPFDFRFLEGNFEAVGEDLKDLYFLAGISLVDTGRYHLTGHLARERRLVRFTELQATSGHSDMQGSVSIVSNRSAPPHVEIELRSNWLRVADLGPRAAGRGPAASEGEAGQHLLSDKPFHLTAMRERDTITQFHAGTLEVGNVVFKSVAAQMKIADGVISISPVSANVRDGKIVGEAKVDVTHDVPQASIDVRVNNLPLDHLRSPPPLLNGPLQGRLELKGVGNSFQALASKANGKITAVLPRGTLRSSAAELAGLDLRGLGLKIAGNHADTQVRCAVASVEVRSGLLSVERLLIDTEPVLITGEGSMDLESEGLDLTLQGHPKHPRLRLQTPVLVHGSWKHPTVGMQMGKPAMQAGGAVALGVLLTPLAAVLAFVDPGLTKDANCSLLLTQATAEQHAGGR